LGKLNPRADLQPSPELEALRSRGKAAEKAGRDKEAAVVYKEILAKAPQNVEALNDLAYIEATSNDSSVSNPQQAVLNAERMIDLSLKRFINRRELRGPANVEKPFTNLPQPPTFFQVRMMNTLAAAYASAGQFTSDAARQPSVAANHICAPSAMDAGALALQNAQKLAAAQPTPENQRLAALLEKNLEAYKARHDLHGVPQP